MHSQVGGWCLVCPEGAAGCPRHKQVSVIGRTNSCERVQQQVVAAAGGGGGGSCSYDWVPGVQMPMSGSLCVAWWPPAATEACARQPAPPWQLLVVHSSWQAAEASPLNWGCAPAGSHRVLWLLTVLEVLLFACSLAAGLRGCAAAVGSLAEIERSQHAARGVCWLLRRISAR
jgi:hypothetical protein